MDAPVSKTEDKSNDDLEDHIMAAKSFLLRSSGKSGITMYDHLVDILTKVLDEKPEKVVDILQDYSRNEKKYKFYPEKDTIQEKQEISSEVILAHEQKDLFNRKDIEVPDTVGDIEAEEEERLILPDIMENAFYFEQAGVGLGREEQFRTFLALKQLTDTYRLKSCRFWGKILGIQSNYIIAEVEFRPGEDPHYNNGEEMEKNDVDNSPLSSPAFTSENGEEIENQDVPKPNYKPPVVIPQEVYGEGCNAKVYYVCNDAGLSWHRLPPVTPQQIQVARQIRKLMTGDLDAPVVSYPPYPGNEANYLRAQIARISAATHISPQGYYIFEEDEEEEDEEEGRTSFVTNEDFEGIPVGDLCDPSFAFWVHHNQYILPQGRTSWFDPNFKNEEEIEDEEDEEEEEREEPEDTEPEEGPALLTPLSEDEAIKDTPAWTAIKSTSLVSQYAIAVMHSNLWPGAHAFATDKKFDNVYIGHGLKYSAENYSPPPPPAVQDEYPSGPEITEAEDPTVEQERALQAAQQEALEAEEEEEESDDYDEDEN
ncbi:radial spoke head protein 4 homolog A-like [Hydractinia symbiolongicarpus]|uniref:radial spoke head protein 4 homolog A-like n=1 Tax=Hydractinia symbiolongicarpus TaxID=13093 RepID=UPI00254C77E3|nr:radial spoke head protein 4 homolog A-like [Hydractinia symbiolongicarpus]